MDQGPFRSSQPAGRSAENEVGSPHGSTGQPKPHHMEPKPVHRVTSRSPFSEKKSNKKLYIAIAVVVAVVVIGVIGFMGVNKLTQASTAIDSSKFQAVFFTNGQVYFGKLQHFNNEYMKLTEVYYLQQAKGTDDSDSKNPQQTSNNQNDATLIKLGDEIHGPEDEMIISKDQVLFYENLKKDGKVSQSIEKYKNPN